MRATIGAALVAAIATMAVAQTPPVRIPDEAAGIGQVTNALMAVFDNADVLALGELHDSKFDSDVRIALVRHPAFAKVVRSIVVEFASTTEQPTLDRYIRGENVPRSQLERVWRSTTQASNGLWDRPMYADFLAAVRDVNMRLSPNGRIRVLGGDPGPTDHRTRDEAAVAVITAQIQRKGEKALVIYGAAHFYRNDGNTGVLASVGGGITRGLDARRPGRTFVVMPLGGPSAPLPPGTDAGSAPDYQKVDGALRNRMRPALVSLKRPPFESLTAAEFLGRAMINCQTPTRCTSVFKGSSLTLGQMADAVVYFGPGN